MNNTKALVAGGTVGALVGWLIATIITDELFPEYYTTEELKEYNELSGVYREVTNDILATDDPTKPKRIKVVSQGDGAVAKIEYGKKYFEEHPEKLPLQELVTKFNGGGDGDELVNDVDEGEEDLDIVDDEEVDFSDEEGGNPRVMEYSEYLETVDTNVDIYIMSEEDYDENPMKFKQTVLHYFDEDDVVTDSEFRPLTREPDRLIGDLALFNFGTFTDHEDQVYVSNPVRGTNFVIHSHDESFDDFIAARSVRKNAFDEYDNKPPEGKEGDDLS